MFKFSSAFNADIVTAALVESRQDFDSLVADNAASGRIAHVLHLAVAAQYGITLPTKPREFIEIVNTDYLLDTALAVGKTIKGKAAPAPQGGKVRADKVLLVQALHACAQALLDGGKCKGLPELLTLPEWANPEAIQAKKDAVKAATKAKKTAIVAESAPENEAGTVAASTAKDNSALTASILATINSGVLSMDNLESIMLACAAMGEKAALV